MQLDKTFHWQEGFSIKASVMVQVDYDPEENVVTDVVGIFASDNGQNFVEITGIPGIGLDDLVDNIDWREVYREKVLFAEIETTNS